MKRFSTYVNEIDVHEQLPEGFARGLTRSAAVIAQANASKRHGDTAVKYLKNVSSILNKPIPQNSDSTDARLDRIEKSLEHMAMAMIATRSQIGAVGSISTSSALLADTVSKAITKR